jgi:hypothetical protein
MIIRAEYRNHVSHTFEREAALLLRGDLADSPGDDTDDDAAEICRMIELSGMISLECGLLGSE